MSTQKDEIFEEIFDELSSTHQDLEKDEVKDAFDHVVSKKKLFSKINEFSEEKFEKLLNDVEAEMVVRRTKPLTGKQESRFVDRIIKTVKKYPDEDMVKAAVYSEMFNSKFNPRPDDVVRQDVESRIETSLARKESLKGKPRDLTKERVQHLFGNVKQKEMEIIYNDYKIMIENGIVSEIRKKKDLLKIQLDECKENCKKGCVEQVISRNMADDAEKMNKKGGAFWEKYIGTNKKPTKEELLQKELEALNIPDLEDIDKSESEESNDNTDAESSTSSELNSSASSEINSSTSSELNSIATSSATNSSDHSDDESSKSKVSFLENPVEYLKDKNNKYKYKKEKERATETCTSLFKFAEDRLPHGFPHSICSMPNRISSNDTVQKCRVVTILQNEIEQVFKLYKDDIKRNESQIAILKNQFSKLRNGSFRGGLLKKTQKRRRGLR